MSKPAAEVEQYHLEARSWELDRAAQAKREVKTYKAVAACSVLLAVLSVAAVIGLTPLKQPVPILIKVDKSTGAVEYLAPFDGTTRQDWTVTQAMLSHYIVSRERYFWGVAEPDYESAQAMNAPPLKNEMAAAWDRTNPQSPINLYKDGTTVETRVTSITPLNLGSGRDNFAQVRFRKSQRQGGTGPEQVTDWIATIEYAYAPARRGEQVDPLNPIGFRVLEYRREPEAVQATTAIAEAQR